MMRKKSCDVFENYHYKNVKKILKNICLIALKIACNKAIFYHLKRSKGIFLTSIFEILPRGEAWRIVENILYIEFKKFH